MKERPNAPENKLVMEGRDLDAKGRPLKDEAFHRKGMGTTPEQELVDAQAVEDSIDDLRERQAEDLAKISKTLGRRSYEDLLALYPDNPRVAKWKKRADELKG